MHSLLFTLLLEGASLWISALHLWMCLCFCVIVIHKDDVNHTYLVELPLTRQMTICNNDRFNCNPLADELGSEQYNSTIYLAWLRCESWLSVGIDPPAFWSS